MELTKKRLCAALVAAVLAALGVLAGHTIDSPSPTPALPQVSMTIVSPSPSSEVRDDLSAGPVDPAPAVDAANQAAALAQTDGPNHPVPLASGEPVTITATLARNYSSRNDARPAILVVHSTESNNVAGLADVRAIAGWFNTPAAQASSNYTTDAEGNTLTLVPETDKAWTQAYFNPWAISDELVGRASQTVWPEEQLRATARLFAAAAARWGIPIQHGTVSGCTITRAGILQHSDLGECGGGHHDAGPAFPIAHFIDLVHEYADGGVKVLPKCSTWSVQHALNLRGAHIAEDGKPGPATTAALLAFQNAHTAQGLAATGTLGDRAVIALGMKGRCTA